ncbi:hypothetical protein LR013_01875 [candidate division NPL-UPA2 bacterium]|nr:hypothetical protein [candidate division NPL-UPA2 bacterium]
MERGNFQTDRYKVSYEEIGEGGPAGWESKYLPRLGEDISDELYHLLIELRSVPLFVKQKNVTLRNRNALAMALQSKSPTGIVSGFCPSGACHFGHVLIASTLSFFQKNGFRIFVPVADIEAMSRGIEKEVYSYWMADNLLDWGAQGLNLDAAHVYLQSEEKRSTELIFFLTTKIAFKDAFDIYGFPKLCDEFSFLFAGLAQVKDLVLPQNQDFGNFHSCMVSGPDQDGHMRMTTRLIEYFQEIKIQIPDVQTTPSALYTPHIRGLSGGKMSSSDPELLDKTLFIGPGPDCSNPLTIEERIRTNLSKIKVTINNISPNQVAKSALDMVRFIDFFGRKSVVDFSSLLHDLPSTLKRRIDQEEDRERKALLIDEYLIVECKQKGQDNVELVRENIEEVIREHHQRRKKVLQHAIHRQEGRASEIEFWEIPQESAVDESLRNKTKWYNIVARMRDRIIP